VVRLSVICRGRAVPLVWHVLEQQSTSVYSIYRRCRVKSIPLARGEAQFWHEVSITAQRFGSVHLALGRPCGSGSRECWYVVSSEPTDRETFAEYGLRFDISRAGPGLEKAGEMSIWAEVLSRDCSQSLGVHMSFVSQPVS
jgi:hypothetical protein